MTKKDHSATRSTILRPSWKQFAIGYILSILTIPIGVGIIGLYFVRKRHKRFTYKVTEDRISSIGQKYRQNMDLVNIEFIKVRKSWFQKKLGIGDLILHTAGSRMKLVGMENPGELKRMIEKAVKIRREGLKTSKQEQHRETDTQPGSMEKMNYLTGLWQQGLLSNEDFDNEKKHFE